MILSRKHFWEVFATKLAFNLKSEISKTYLGYLWWILEPVLYVCAMYLVFGILLNTRTDQFMLFLVAGQVPFQWFSRSVQNASSSILSNKGLINHVAIPKAMFPLLTISQDLVKQLVVFVAMIGFFLVMGLEPSIHWLAFVLVAAVEFLLIMGVSMAGSAIVPYFPDFRFLISTGMRLLMFGSGIFYDYQKVVLPEHRELFLLNPLANLLSNYREIFLHNQWPDWQALAAIALIATALITIMYFYFRSHETEYARLITQ